MHNELVDINLTLVSPMHLIRFNQHLTAYYNKTTKKWYEINSDGTIGGEIKMSQLIPDYANKVTVTSSMSNPPENGFMEIIDTPGKGTQCYINGGDYHRSIFGFVPVTPDDVLTYGQYYNNVCYFYPARNFE